MKHHELKGIKCNDLLEESSVTREVWQHIHALRQTRRDILHLLLPEDLYAVYSNDRETIEQHIFHLLADEINSIIQDNFFFLVENNFSNKAVVGDLFDQVCSQLAKRGSGEKLNEITVDST